MAYGYGSWSQITAPKTSGSSTAFTSAGSLFNDALDAAKQGVQDFKAAQDTALKRAQENNLANLIAQSTAAEQGGLEKFNPFQAALQDPAFLAQYDAGNNQKLIDPTKIPELLKAGQQRAFEQTLKTDSGERFQELRDIQEFNAGLYNQLLSDPKTGFNQFIKLDAGNNPVLKSYKEAVPFTGDVNDPAAVNQWLQGEQAYNQQSQEAFGRFSSSLQDLGRKEFGAIGRIKAEAREAGVQLNMNPDQLAKYEQTLVDQEQRLLNLSDAETAQVEAAVAANQPRMEAELAVIDSELENRLKDPKYLVTDYSKYDQPTAAFLKEIAPGQDWLQWFNKEGINAVEFADKQAKIFKELTGQTLTDAQKNLLLLKSANSAEEGYFTLSDADINTDAFKNYIEEAGLAIIQGGDTGFSTEATSIARSSLSNLYNARKQSIRDKYVALDNLTRNRILGQLGYQVTRGNTKVLKDALAKYSQQSTTLAPQAAKAGGVSTSRTTSGSTSGSTSTGNSTGSGTSTSTTTTQNTGSTYDPVGVTQLRQRAAQATNTTAANDPNSFQNLPINEWVSNFIDKQADEVVAGFKEGYDTPYSSISINAPSARNFGNLYGSTAGAIDNFVYPASRVRQSNNDELTGFDSWVNTQETRPASAIINQAKANAVRPNSIEALRLANVGPNVDQASINAVQAGRQATSIPPEDLNIAPQITPNVANAYQQTVQDRAANMAYLERLQGNIFEVMRSLQNVPTQQLQQLLNSNASIVIKTAAQAVLNNR